MIYIENHVQSLKRDGIWTALPDGTRQPLNLLEAIADVVESDPDFKINKLMKKKQKKQKKKNVQIAANEIISTANIAGCDFKPDDEERRWLERMNRHSRTILAEGN